MMRHVSSRGAASLAVLLIALTAVVASPPSVSAHNFTRTDGNDSPGKLDLKSVSVSHTTGGVVHKVQTYNAWTTRSLEHDSFFVIGIDKNEDQHYERCAFIFKAGTKLRGSLTNCGSNFIRFLHVSKPSGTVAKITIPKYTVGGVYWWSVASIWDGPAPCANGCVDFAPNRFPDILHDLTPPAVTMDTSDLDVWEDSTSTSFVFPFITSDSLTSVQSWTVQRRPLDASGWIVVLSGTGGGFKDPLVPGVEGERANYRVVATDKQGNRRVGSMRRVNVPIDQGSVGFLGSYPGLSTPVEQFDADAFGGSYMEIDAGESFEYDFSISVGGPLDCIFKLIGPKTGTWSVDVKLNGVVQSTITSDGSGGQREVLATVAACGGTIGFDVITGTGFGVDAVFA